MVEDATLNLYTGCTIRTRLPHLEKSARVVFEKLGIQLSELEGASCCPEPVGMRGMDQEAWLTLAARNLALARHNSLSLMTLCSGCFNTFQEARHLLTKNSSLRQKVNHTLEKIGFRYSPGMAVEHFAGFLFDKIGLTKLSSRVTDSWRGLPVAFHHGCHFLRPTHVMAFDDPENPTKLEQLIGVLGAEIVDYPRKMLCCGFPIQTTDTDLSLQLAYEKLKLMKAYGARTVIVVCPSCYLQFDLMQRSIERKFDVSLQLPVFYLTEFIGLAMGLKPSDLGLSFHRVDTFSIVREIFPGLDTAN
jgi:heterodisulfide reductase subunit B